MNRQRNPRLRGCVGAFTYTCVCVCVCVLLISRYGSERPRENSSAFAFPIECVVVVVVHILRRLYVRAFTQKYPQTHIRTEDHDRSSYYTQLIVNNTLESIANCICGNAFTPTVVEISALFLSSSFFCYW